MDERVTLYSDPADPDLLALPFDVEGLPLSAWSGSRKGVLQNLVVHALLGAEAEGAADGHEQLRRRSKCSAADWR